MTSRKHLLAIAVAAMLSACGGGSESTITQQQFASAMAAAPRADAVTADAAAEEIFAKAQAEFAAFFPGSPATQSFGPFKYRQYANGVILGVVVTAGQGYDLHGVYVVGMFGGTLDAPAKVGQITDFGVSVTPGTGGGGNNCFDLSLLDTQGTRMVVAYQYSGVITGNQTVDTTVGGLATFEGHSARETTVVTTGTSTTAGQTIAIDFTAKNYSKLTGTAQVTQYGSISTASGTTEGMTYQSVIRTVYTPPYVESYYNLGVGQSSTTTVTGSMTSTTKFTGMPDYEYTQALNDTSTVTYVGQESVTVPAGTYNTCKFTHTTPASGGSAATTVTSWYIVGKGIPVQITTSSDGTFSIKATSVTLNGASL